MKTFLKYSLTAIAFLLLSGFIWWNVSDYQVYEDRTQMPMSAYVDIEADFQNYFN